MDALYIAAGVLFLLAPEICKIVQEFVKEEN